MTEAIRIRIACITDSSLLGDESAEEQEVNRFD